MQDAWSYRSGRAGAAYSDELDRLAAATANGSRTAFEQIYHLLVDDVYAYARAQCTSDADAEDIVSIVFLKAWQFARHYRVGSGGYRNWIFGIARNQVRNHWRALKNSRRLEQALMTRHDPVAAEPGANIDWTALSQALANLTSEQREVITLRYLNGRTPAEVALILGKTEGSVRALQHRALQQLRKAVTRAAA